MAAGEQMKRIRASLPRIRRERHWPEDLPDDPRDPDVVRAKALARRSRVIPGQPGAPGSHDAPGHARTARPPT
jgi:hypothetical protein